MTYLYSSKSLVSSNYKFSRARAIEECPGSGVCLPATTFGGEAANLEFRSNLLIIMRKIFESSGWELPEVMEVLHISKDKAEELINGRIWRFSSGEVISYMTMLGICFMPTLSNIKTGDLEVTCEVMKRAAID